MKQIQAFLNDREQFCDTRECEGLIRIGELAVKEYRKIGKPKVHHNTCWQRVHTGVRK